MALAKRNSKSNGSYDSRTKPLVAPVRYVICIKNEGYPASLELRKVYKTVSDPEAARHGMLRVIDESDDDYLYPQDFFIPISLPKAAEVAFSQV